MAHDDCLPAAPADPADSPKSVSSAAAQAQHQRAGVALRTARELHLGGGTPNSVRLEALKRLVDHLRAVFVFDDDAELSIELDPRRVVPGQLQALRDLGFDRVSFGVQDTDDDVQHAIGRDQSVEVTRAAVNDARAAGFASVNIDLVYGLRQQTTDSFAATVSEVIALRPDRIALFSCG